MNAITQPETAALLPAPRQQFDLSPQTFEQALTFSDYLAASEMVPKVYRGKPGDCLIAMQWGFEVGLKPLQALQSIATINGKPGLYGDAGKAILLSNGCIIEEDDIAIVEKNQRGRCKITRPGRPPVERTFSLENAKTAGLWGKEGPWRTYPWRQMAWRAFWFAARDAASDLLRGLPGAEEVMDTPTERYMGPVDVVTPEKPEAPKLPLYTAEDFEKNMVIWRKVIAGGKKDVDGVLATVATIATLTEDQVAAIRAIPGELTKAAGQRKPERTGPETSSPAATYAQVVDKLHKAANLDALNEAATLIAAVPDEGQRGELNTIYEDCAATLG